MKNKIIKVGVIGLGVGEAHIKSYEKIKNVQVTSICDINSKRLLEVKKNTIFLMLIIKAKKLLKIMI